MERRTGDSAMMESESGGSVGGVGERGIIFGMGGGRQSDFLGFLGVMGMFRGFFEGGLV